MGGMYSESTNYIVYGAGNYNPRVAKILERLGKDSFENIMGSAFYYPYWIAQRLHDADTSPGVFPMIGDVYPSTGARNTPADTYLLIQKMYDAGKTDMAKASLSQMNRIWTMANNGGILAHKTHKDSNYISKALWYPGISLSGFNINNNPNLFPSVFFLDNENFPPSVGNRVTTYPNPGKGGIVEGHSVLNGQNELHYAFDANFEHLNHNARHNGELLVTGVGTTAVGSSAVRLLDGPGRSDGNSFQSQGPHFSNVARKVGESQYTFGSHYYIPPDPDGNYPNHYVLSKVLGRIGDITAAQFPTTWKLEKARRTVALVRGFAEADPYLVVYDILNDNVASTAFATYGQYWHTPVQATGTSPILLVDTPSVDLEMRYVTPGVNIIRPTSSTALNSYITAYKNDVQLTKPSGGDANLLAVMRLKTAQTQTPTTTDISVSGGQGTKLSYLTYTDIISVKNDNAATQSYTQNTHTIATDAAVLVVRLGTSNTILGFMANDLTYITVDGQDLVRVTSSGRISLSAGGVNSNGNGGIQITPVQLLDIPTAPVPTMVINLPTSQMLIFLGQQDVWFYGERLSTSQFFVNGNQVVIGTQSCTGNTFSCPQQQGVCAGSLATCQTAAWQCSAQTYSTHNAAYQAIETTCDGLDNDCDGSIDEMTQNDPNSCGSCNNVCSLYQALGQTCASGICQIGTCAPGYGNCDGLLSTGCETNTLTSTTNCGTCTNACSYANAAATCQNGNCQMGTCNAGFANCDGSAANGCESNILSSPQTCGGCTTSCSYQNGNAGCSGGNCQLTSCSTGYANCDNNIANGCEANLQTSTSTCGSCISSCSYPNAAPGCSAGICLLNSCTTGFGNCDNNNVNGCEVNLQTNANNCNTCGNSCSYTNAQALCASGQCALGTCNSGYGNCDSINTNGCESNLQTSALHCGSCTATCSYANAAGLCVSSACLMGPCSSGYGNCDGIASNGCETNLQTSTNNCGTCGSPCTYPHSQTSCAVGNCQFIGCDSGYYNNNGILSDGCEYQCLATNGGVEDCTDSIDNDCDGDIDCMDSDCTSAPACSPQTCTVPCSGQNANALCIGSTCTLTCLPDFGNCDNNNANGCETSLLTSTANCGSCSYGCSLSNAQSACVSGACSISSCAANFANCDGIASNGCETNTQTSASNCGSCSAACSLTNAVSACSSGSCSISSCAQGYGNCDGSTSNGCEAGLLTDPNHCGLCTTTCRFPNADPRCVSGQCSLGTCYKGYADCDANTPNGCETNTLTSVANCGGCGTVCSYPHAQAACASSVCTFTGCNPGYYNINGILADGCEYSCSVTNNGVEICDGADNNCDGEIDEGVTQTFYADNDNDGYGISSVTIQSCSVLSGYSVNNQDCDDSDNQIHPGAAEACNNVDDDCDGIVDQIQGQPITRTCYSGPTLTLGIGLCTSGTQTCTSGAYNNCENEILPSAELCDGEDNDCDTVIDNQCNHAPTFTSPISSAQTNEGAVYQASFPAVDQDNDPLSYSITGIPSTALLNPQTGQLLWNVGFEEQGNYIVTVTVTDGINPPALQSFVLDVKNCELTTGTFSWSLDGTTPLSTDTTVNEGTTVYLLYNQVPTAQASCDDVLVRATFKENDFPFGGLEDPQPPVDAGVFVITDGAGSLSMPAPYRLDYNNFWGDDPSEFVGYLEVVGTPAVSTTTPFYVKVVQGDNDHDGIPADCDSNTDPTVGECGCATWDDVNNVLVPDGNPGPLTSCPLAICGATPCSADAYPDYQPVNKRCILTPDANGLLTGIYTAVAPAIIPTGFTYDDSLECLVGTCASDIGCTTDEDQDGAMDRDDLCQATATGTSVNQLGQPLPLSDEFTGSQTTRFISTDLASSAFTLRNNYGQVKYLSTKDIAHNPATQQCEQTNLNALYEISDGTLFIDTAARNDLGSNMKITIINIRLSSPVIYIDNNPCTTCTIESYANGQLTFSVG